MKVIEKVVSEASLKQIILTPGQQRTYDLANAVTRVAPILLVEGAGGLGKTTVLRRLSEATGGTFLSTTEILDAIGRRSNPIEVDEAIREALAASFHESDLVILDDFDTAMAVTMQSQAYPRPYLLDAVLKEAYAQATKGGKKLVFAITHAWASYEEHWRTCGSPGVAAFRYRRLRNHIGTLPGGVGCRIGCGEGLPLRIEADRPPAL